MDKYIVYMKNIAMQELTSHCHNKMLHFALLQLECCSTAKCNIDQTRMCLSLPIWAMTFPYFSSPDELLIEVIPLVSKDR